MQLNAELTVHHWSLSLDRMHDIATTLVQAKTTCSLIQTSLMLSFSNIAAFRRSGHTIINTDCRLQHHYIKPNRKFWCDDRQYIEFENHLNFIFKESNVRLRALWYICHELSSDLVNILTCSIICTCFSCYNSLFFDFMRKINSKMKQMQLHL